MRYLLFLLAVPLSLFGAYICGDSFRSYADFIYDERAKTLNITQMRTGNTVFLSGDLLDEFFENVHPLIPCPYILITHNSDHPIPQRWPQILDDPKLIVWFGQNVSMIHPKLKTLPIGIANPHWGHGNPALFDRAERTSAKQWLLYLNFSIWTHAQVRQGVYDLFASKDYCHVAHWKNTEQYLTDLSRSHFILSPRGNGLDCHRTWESLYMRAYPIVKASPMDPVFENLPVLIIENWEEITPDFLKMHYMEMRDKRYQWEKLEPEYWFALINGYKTL